MTPTDPDDRTAPELPAGSALGYDPSKPIMTLGDLLDSPLVGLWEQREDITDSERFARGLGRHPRPAE